MKLAPFLIGAISAQSGDDADRWDNTDFSLTDSIFTYDAPKEQRFDGSGCTTELVIQAVTCWESNHMGNLDHYVTTNDDGFGWKNIHHGHDQGGHSGQAAGDGLNAGFGQGTQESTNYGKRVPSTSPNYQIGTYSRGMATDGVGTARNRIDYHSAMAFDNRYSGCIYEAAGWNYDATTYNAIWRMSYGYDPARIETKDTSGNDFAAGVVAAGDYLNDASGVDRSNDTPIRPNWWHYFNSHILNVGQFDNAFDSYERHLLVMANPAYEGLGYLNWITTFAKYSSNSHADGNQKKDRGQWGGTNEFTGFVGSDVAKSSASGGYNADAPATTTPYDEGRFRGMINHNTHDTVTDLYSGGYAFHLAMGCPTRTSSTMVTEMPVYHDSSRLVSDDGKIAKIGSNSSDQNMNPEINLTARTGETNMHTAGYFYDSYEKTTAHPASGEELDQWYSFLINPGSQTITDPALNAITDSGKKFYPWMSLAAVSSFPHNDLGQDFRFNIRILHHGGRGFPYNFLGNSASSVLLTDSDLDVDDGAVAGNTNFAITHAQINYLAQDSYYWYKVNTVQIMFPSYVRCPRYYRNITSDKTTVTLAGTTSGGMGESLKREEDLDDTFRCMDSANFNGHRGWDSSKPYQHNIDDVYAASAWNGIDSTATTGNHRPDVNHPIYLEQLTENDGSKYVGIVVDHNKNADTTVNDPLLDSADGFICGDVPPFGSGAGDYKGGWYKCGQKYAVHGLMNAYDEHAQMEYGTTQEIWFQFWYHYVITWETSAGQGTSHGFWDKRNSNTNRYHSNKSSATNPTYTWPGTSVDDGTQKIFHDGAHDEVYFTMTNYRNDYAAGGGTTRYDHVHNFPNILFNAFELRGIRFYCDKVNSLNSNECFHTGLVDPGTDGYDTAGRLIGDSMINP